MQVFFKILILFSSFFTLSEGIAATELSSPARLVMEMCRNYAGEDISTFISSGQIQNPLAASSTGRKIMSRNFNEAYVYYNYFSPDDMVKHFIDDPDYPAALTECYGSNEAAKMNFTFFLSSLELQAKSNAALLELTTWSFEGAGFLKVATWLSRRYRLAKSILQISAKASKTLAVLFTGQVAYHFIQYKRGNLKKAELALNSEFIENAKNDLEDSKRNANGAVEDLKSQLEILNQDIMAEKDPNQTIKLVELKEETLKILNQLNQQLKN